jgi:hypothetical protein
MPLDTSRLPKDALTYTDKQSFKLIQSFRGKDGSDLMSIQTIRSVDSFLSIQDIYTIFELDSEDVQEIQKQCGFRKRNETYTVKPGIKSSLDYVSALLKEMQKQISKSKKFNQVQINQPVQLKQQIHFLLYLLLIFHRMLIQLLLQSSRKKTNRNIMHLLKSQSKTGALNMEI